MYSLNLWWVTSFCLDLLFSPVNRPSIPALLMEWNPPVSSSDWESQRATLLANKVKNKKPLSSCTAMVGPFKFLFSFCARTLFSNLRMCSDWTDLVLLK